MPRLIYRLRKFFTADQGRPILVDTVATNAEDVKKCDDHSFSDLLNSLRFPPIFSYFGTFTIRGFSFPRDFFSV